MGKGRQEPNEKFCKFLDVDPREFADMEVI